MAEAEDEACLKVLLQQSNDLIHSVGVHVLRTLLEQLVKCFHKATFSELVEHDSVDPGLKVKQEQFKRVYKESYFKADQIAAIKTGLVKTFDIPLLKKLIRTEIVSGYIVSDGRWKELVDCVESNSLKIIDEMWQPSTTEDKLAVKVAVLVLVLQYWRNELAHRKVPEAYKPDEIQAMRRNIEVAVWSLAGILKIDDEELFKDEKSHCMKLEPDKIYQYVRDSPKQACNVVEALPGKDLSLDLQSDDLMPMVFTAKKLKLTSLHMANQSPTQDKYEDVDYKNDFDKVIEELVNGKRVVICEGDAGMGKTISFKRIVSSYYNSESDFPNKLKNVKQFNLVFYIPVRHIDTKAKLIDVICCQKKGMGYVKPYMRETVKHILEDPEMGSKVLILLDGVDEREIPEGSDLYKLMTGEIPPQKAGKKVKLMIATQPEAHILTKLRNFDPDLKIQLKGTNNEGVKEYLSRSKALGKEVEKILKICEEKMVDYSILHVPLYLTLIRYIFEEHSNKGTKSLGSFNIPESMTELFKEFLLLLIRIWLERSGIEVSSLTFDKNPLDVSSTIPAHIKRILVCFAKMSYDCLLDEVYDFSNNHLQEYRFVSEELKATGFFAWSEVDGQLCFCFTHKQFQEYFAALHIADSGYSNIESFRKRIDKAQSTKDKKSLKDIFEKLEMTMKFVFGLNPELCVRLLEDLKKHTSLTKDIRTSPKLAPYLQYELQLLAENCSSKVCQTMAELLLSAEVKEEVTGNSFPDFYFPVRLSEVRSFVNIAKNFKIDERILLMKRWFDITVELKNKTVEQESQCEAVITSDKLNNLYYFRHNLFILMAPFVFPDVRKLSFHYSDVSDVSLFIGISFPGLHSFKIHSCLRTVMNELIDQLLEDYCQNTWDGSSLTNVTVALPVSARAMNSLRKLNNLQCLKMSGSFDYQYSNIISGIICILSQNQALKELFILNGQPLPTEQLKLLTDAIDKLTCLKKIYLTFMIPNGDIDMLFGHVKQWRNVESLGLNHYTIYESGDQIAGRLNLCPNIKEIIVVHDHNKDIYLLIDFSEKMHSLDTDLKIPTPAFDDIWWN